MEEDRREKVVRAIQGWGLHLKAVHAEPFPVLRVQRKKEKKKPLPCP